MIPWSDNPFPAVVVLLDPSSLEGDAGVGLASSLVGPLGRLVLAVPVSGPHAWPFPALAESERVTVADAARVYLRQVAARADAQNLTVKTLDGDDLATDLTRLVLDSRADALVVPAGMVATVLPTKQHSSLPFPVLVAPGRTVTV